jgi:hypothetical protein
MEREKLRVAISENAIDDQGLIENINLATLELFG